MPVRGPVSDRLPGADGLPWWTVGLPGGEDKGTVGQKGLVEAFRRWAGAVGGGGVCNLCCGRCKVEAVV